MRDFTDHDELTVVKALARGKNFAFAAAAAGVDEAKVREVADGNGWPDREKLAWAVDVIQGRIDAAAEIPTRTTPRPHPREHAARAAGATLAQAGAAEAPQSLMLPIDQLVDHDRNVRHQLGDLSELAASIQTNGLLQPVVVTRHPSRAGRWLLLAGHRRIAACRLLGSISHVPAVVRNVGDDDTVHLALMLVENYQRRNLSPLEKAEALGVLVARGLNQSQIARRTGINVSHVNNLLALLELDDTSLDQIRAGTLTAGDAIAQVKRARKTARRKAGAPDRGRPVVAKVQYFTRLHPLADQVKTRCDHTTLPKLGGIGCGACWEAVIRDDALAGATT